MEVQRPRHLTLVISIMMISARFKTVVGKQERVDWLVSGNQNLKVINMHNNIQRAW